MGLFGKVFEKKECSICGGEIGLLWKQKANGWQSLQELCEEAVPLV